MSNETLPRLFEGEFTGRCIKAEYGTGKNDKPSARALMEITEGPRKGTQVPYEANFKAESIKYTKRDLMALGWSGRTIATYVEDVTKANKTVTFQVRIAEYTNPETGKFRQWLSVGSIGNAAPPLSAPTQTTTRSVDSWFAEVDDSGHPNAPGSSYDTGTDSDAPF